MCGRYALALRPSQVRHMLEDDNLPVADAPSDESNDSPRQSYNFAPGYAGLVYRADTPDWGAGQKRGSRQSEAEVKTEVDVKENTNANVQYKLQTMRWGLIPSWTKRAPNYTSVMRTINCRSDSLATSGGMWQGMKGRKRCIVLAQGFFEWLKTGSKNKVPYYIRRKDGRLMCFAGLWDCVRYEGVEGRLYSYTIITTDSSKELEFIHDRMPVIFDPDSESLQQWLDPSRHEWSQDLQCSLKPFNGELEVYPVKKDVGKVVNDSPSFILPLDSEENKSNITHFFPTSPGKGPNKKDAGKQESRKLSVNDSGATAGASLEPHAKSSAMPASGKRKRLLGGGPHFPVKKPTSAKSSTISSSRNRVSDQRKPQRPGPQKITRFFGQGA